MNAIISRGDKTAHVQLPVGRKQLSGALSYLGANHTYDYDLRYNEENKDGLKVSLECFGVAENAIAKALPVGFCLYTPNEALTLMGNLPYQNRREVENTIKVDGLEFYEQFNKMLVDSYPQSVTTKYYCPLTVQVHGRDSYGDIDKNGNQIKAGMDIRMADGSFERVYETTDTYGNPDLGINASNEEYLERHPYLLNCENEKLPKETITAFKL